MRNSKKIHSQLISTIDIQILVSALNDLSEENGKCFVSLIELSKATGMFVDEIMAGLDYLLDQGILLCQDTCPLTQSNPVDIHHLWSWQLKFNFTPPSQKTGVPEDVNV
jgi:hypothetical protein